MASHIEVTADVDDSFERAALREELSALTDDDVSQSSPISEGAPEAGIAHNRAESVVTVRVEGHGGSWTKTSMDALRTAVGRVDGVLDASVTDGGYDANG
jgi:hypothetical protein